MKGTASMQTKKWTGTDWFENITVCLWATLMTGIIIYYGIIKNDDKSFYLGLIGLLVAIVFLHSIQIRQLRKLIGGK